MKDIFSTKERIKILQAIIFKEENISVNNIANQLGLSKGLISKYFGILVKEGILKRTRRRFSATDSSLVKGIRILLNIKNINHSIFKKYGFIKSVGLYGSCAKGESTEESDIDLWIKVKNAGEEELASLTADLNKKIENIKILFLTDKKIEKMRKEDLMFYHSLVFGSIILYGEKDGVQI